jgi:AcrR family transcriptional regulator
MGGNWKINLPSDARTYSESDWLVFGMTGTPNTREKLIALTIEEIVKNGPSEFNAKDICDRIDAKHALVNYYFGNKEMLIAEANL